MWQIKLIPTKLLPWDDRVKLVNENLKELDLSGFKIIDVQYIDSSDLFIIKYKQ